MRGRLALRTASPIVDWPFAVAPLWWRSPPAIALPGANAVLSGSVTCSWPTTSANVAGRGLDFHAELARRTAQSGLAEKAARRHT